MFPRLVHDIHNLSDYHYGFGGFPSLLLDDYVYPPHVLLYNMRPRRHTSVSSKIADSKRDANQFKVMLNVKQFRPEEIEVKTVENSIVIRCKHEEHADEHGLVSRAFTRRYQLPDDVEPHTVKSSLSQDGVLTITAPRKAIEPPSKNERVVPIHIQLPIVVEEFMKQLQRRRNNKIPKGKSN